MATICVIVPVYKVEPYLHRCVDSILAQTCRDFELILVDDGSPDSCGAICDEYAQKEERVHVIHQENGGLSAARNAGIDWVFANSGSQWLTFVDSDDWIHPEMLERLLDAAKECGTKISVSEVIKTHKENLDFAQLKSRCEVWKSEDFYTSCRSYASIACAKLYHRDCFETVRYPVGRLHEDEFVTYKLLFAEENIAVIDAPFYFYFQNTDGITKSNWTPKRLDCLQALEEQTAFFHRNKFEKAFAQSVNLYAETILLHRGYLNQSNLPAQDKRSIQYYLQKCLRRAAWKYGKVYLGEQQYGVYVEAFPWAAGVLRKMKRVIKAVLKK